MPQILGKEVGPIGLGLMGFTSFAGRPDGPSIDESVEVLKAAFNNGMTLWNGAEIYGNPEKNSMTLVNAYFTKYPEDADKVILSMKGCLNPATYQPDGSPEFVRQSIDNILQQLGGKKKLDLFSCARRDPKTSFDVTMSVIKNEYIDTGKIGGFALSECSVETIEQAVKYTKVHLAELELSMFSPDILNNGIAAACAANDIAIIAYSPIGRGMLTGKYRTAEDFQGRGLISQFPRFQKEAFDHNIKLVHSVEALAKKKGCTTPQLAISWVQHNSKRSGVPTVIPIPGAVAVSRVTENAELIPLSEADFAAISDIVHNFKTVGSRYPDQFPVNT